MWRNSTFLLYQPNSFEKYGFLRVFRLINHKFNFSLINSLSNQTFWLVFLAFWTRYETEVMLSNYTWFFKIIFMGSLIENVIHQRTSVFYTTWRYNICFIVPTKFMWASSRMCFSGWQTSNLSFLAEILYWIKYSKLFSLHFELGVKCRSCWVTVHDSSRIFLCFN